MIRAVNGIKVIKGSLQRRRLSVVPPEHPTGGGPENNKYFIGAGVFTVAVLCAAYKLESDPKTAKEWKDTPGIGLLDPVRVLFREAPKPTSKA